jgi:hypothetical protein
MFEIFAGLIEFRENGLRKVPIMIDGFPIGGCDCDNEIF